MDDFTPDELREARAPIASLAGKSEKALRKLTPGTWQHTMLTQNVKALAIVSALMEDGALAAERTSDPELQEALDALEAMAGRTENARMRFAPGTSQHTLQRNRLKALRIAESLVTGEMDRRARLASDWDRGRD